MDSLGMEHINPMENNAVSTISDQPIIVTLPNENNLVMWSLKHRERMRATEARPDIHRGST